jgi:hypothetical protein
MRPVEAGGSGSRLKSESSQRSLPIWTILDGGVCDTACCTGVSRRSAHDRKASRAVDAWHVVCDRKGDLLRGSWLIPVVLCVLLLGCAPQTPEGSRGETASPTPAQSVVGSWGAETTMTIGGALIPASTSAVFEANGTLSLTASSPALGELFSGTGTWRLMPDGKTVQVSVEDATSTATLSGDRLLWRGSVWSRR